MKVVDSTIQAYETELVEKLRSGDRAAMEEFYNIYKGRLYSLVFEQVGGGQPWPRTWFKKYFLLP